MILYVNEKNEIKDVHATNDTTLMAVEVPGGVFDGWSVAKILCHRLNLENGMYAGYSPAVDTRIIEHIDRLGANNEATAEDVANTQFGLMETYEQTEANTSEITNVQLAIMELYEMILGE